MQFYSINIRPKLHRRNWRVILPCYNMSTATNFLDFTINAVLHPTFIRKLCYKLSSLVSFTFLQIFPKLCLLYWIAAELPRLLDTASKFVLFSVSGLKDEKLIK